MAAAEGRNRRSNPVGIPNRWIDFPGAGAAFRFFPEAAATEMPAGLALESALLSVELFNWVRRGALATAFSGAGFRVPFGAVGLEFESTAFSGNFFAAAGGVLLRDLEDATALGAVLGVDLVDFSDVSLATAVGFGFGFGLDVDFDVELAVVDFGADLLEAGLEAGLFFTGGEAGAARPSRELAGGIT